MRLTQIDGLPVFDSKKSIKININKNDIDRANAKEPTDCAVARACRRSLHVKEVRVHLGRVYLRANDGNWVRYLTTPALRTEIIAFDRGGQFSSGEYTLKGVPPAHKLGKPKGTSSTKREVAKKGKGKKRSAYHVVTNVRQGVA